VQGGIGSRSAPVAFNKKLTAACDLDPLFAPPKQAISPMILLLSAQ
jgi:hypothetical protein